MFVLRISLENKPSVVSLDRDEGGMVGVGEISSRDESDTSILCVESGCCFCVVRGWWIAISRDRP